MSTDSQPVAFVLFGVLEVTAEAAVKVALTREGTCGKGHARRRHRVNLCHRASRLKEQAAKTRRLLSSSCLGEQSQQGDTDVPSFPSWVLTPDALWKAETCAASWTRRGASRSRWRSPRRNADTNLPSEAEAQEMTAASFSPALQYQAGPQGGDAEATRFTCCDPTVPEANADVVDGDQAAFPEVSTDAGEHQLP